MIYKKKIYLFFLFFSTYFEKNSLELILIAVDTAFEFITLT